MNKHENENNEQYNNEFNHEEQENKPSRVSMNTFIISLLGVLILAVGGTALGMTLWFSVSDLNEGGTETETIDIIPEDPSDDESGDGQTDDDESSETRDLTDVHMLYNILMNEYFEEVDSDVLIEGALEGMADSIGDPYTEYLDEVESSSMTEDMQGSFEGIGAEVMKEGDFVVIVSPFPGSPAEESGLLPNDYIVEVDSESVADLSINEAVELIRGPQGSEVELLIQRGENQFEVTIERDSIPIESVVYEVDEDYPTIGHVHITNFIEPTYDELLEAIQALEADGVEQFIFDVRGNPGGLLDMALKLSNIFVEDGEPLMQVDYRGQDIETFYASSEPELFGDYKFEGEAVLLIDGGSASASEILAGAMQSVDIPIIGSTTFGKGTVQMIRGLSLDNNSEIKFTSGRWLTASGDWIHDEGLEPDIAVDMPEYQTLLLINQDEVYEQGDVSAEVENINSILDALGFDVGEGGNAYSEETVNAVEQFQTEQEIEVTGVVTGETANELITTLRQLIEENDTQYDAAVDYFQD